MGERITITSMSTRETRDDEIASGVPANLDALPRLDGFRLRGIAMTRLETFIDAAFAFAVTMMVIAAERVPDDITELLAAFKHVPAFVGSVVVLGIFWRGHWVWSRRYGLEDGVSIFISWALLVTILIYIYPLKAIFGSMFHLLSDGRLGQPLGVRTAAQFRTIFAIYAIGFTAIAVEIAAALSARLEIARAVAIKCAGTVPDARRRDGMEHSGDHRGDCAGPGADSSRRPISHGAGGFIFRWRFWCRCTNGFSPGERDVWRFSELGRRA